MTNNLLSGNFNCLLFVDCFQLETHERLARVFNNAKIDRNVPDSQARCGTILEPLEKALSILFSGKFAPNRSSNRYLARIHIHVQFMKIHRYRYVDTNSHVQSTNV